MTQTTIQEDGRFIEIILLEAVSVGFVVHQHQVIGVALTSGEVGDKIAVDTEGVHILPAITTIAFIAGEELHWDGSKVTNGRSQNVLIGTAYTAKDISENKAQVKLHSFLTSLGGTVDPSEMESSITGGIITFNVNNVGVIIEPGNFGKVLTSNGPGVEPTYQNSVGGTIELNEISDTNHGSLVIINSSGIGDTISADTLGKVLTANGPENAPSFKTLPADNIGANAALSNLASVAINTSLLPAVTETIDLGSTSLRFNDIYTKNIDISGGVVLGGDLDLNGNKITQSGANILSATNSSAGVNYFNIHTGNLGISPKFEVAGPSADINMKFHSKGRGSFIIFGNDIIGDILIFNSDVINHNGFYTFKLPDGFANTSCVFPLTSTTLIGNNTTDTVTNKNIDADFNTITNIGSSEIKSEIITGQISSTVVAADNFTFSDTSDAGALKRDKVQGIIDLSGDMFLADVQTITGAKTFSDSTFLLNGSTSGTSILNAAAVAGSTTLTLPASTTILLGDDTTDILTNKNIDADSNTILNIGSGEIKSELITGQTDTVVSTTDSFLYSDSSDSGDIKKDTVQGIVDLAVSASAGGAWRFVESKSVTSGTDVQFTNLTGTGEYHFIFSGLKPSSDANLQMRFMVGNTIITTNYQYLLEGHQPGSSAYVSNTNVMLLSGDFIGADTDEHGASGSATLGPFNSNTMPVMMQGSTAYLDFASSRLTRLDFAGVAQVTGTGTPTINIDGFVFFWSSAASFIAQGTITVYEQVVS